MARPGRSFPTQPMRLGPVASGGKVVSVGQAVETDIALGRDLVAVGQATESDSATAMTIPMVVGVGQAVDTQEAQRVRATKLPVLGWKIQIDWDADGFTDGDVVTGDVLERAGITMEYGRDQARSLSPMAAGRAALELNNRSRDYSPDNLASPLYGKLIQARPLRVRATLDDQAMNANPLMIHDVDDWTGASATPTHSTAVVHPDAVGSMLLTPSGGTAGGAGSGLVAVTARASYTASMWAYSPGGWSTGVQVLINWYSAGDVFMYSDTGTLTALPAGQWTEIGDSFVAPATAVKAAVWAWQAGTPTSGDIWYAWDVRLAPASGVNTLFHGFTDEWTIQPMPEERSVAITGLDAVARLQGAKVTTQLYRSVRTGTAIGYILDALGWPADMRDLDPGATIVRWWWVEDGDAFEAAEALVRSEGPSAILYADEFGRIVFRDRHHRLLNDASRFAQATFVDSSEDGEPAFSQFTYDHGWREVVNSVSIKVDELDPPPAAEQVWSSESIVNIAASSSLVLRITLDDPVYEATGNFEVIGGSATQSLTANSGQTLTWTITAGAGGATLANLEILGQPVAVRRSYTVLKEDQSSINSYGLRSQTYEVPWAGINDADAIGQSILEASAQRRPIVTITLVSGTWVESERLRQQLSRDLSDRVHVREPETQVDHDFYVERIGHTIGSAGLTVETTIGMERAILQADNVFRFDDSDHGFDDGVFASVSLTDPSVLFRFDVAGQGFDDGVFAT